MSHDNRPDPDAILEHIRDQQRGQLTIFLGYAAGVGKTYAMLETAHQRLAEGVDVVAGYIEPHKRPATEALMAGLQIVPKQQIEYRNTVLEEMDLDAVLARHPQIALVDELAHTNAPGARHPKRYQDVEELLAAGIDVYTTLNVQHLESLNDVVAQITGVVVRETLPDQLIDLANNIVMIDLPPAELIDRLKAGKVYVSEQASHAVEKFFREGNLTALREMALRRTVKRVDEQMTAYMQTRAIQGPWAAGEKLLVCVSPSPFSQKLIRSACRLSGELDAEWIALYVETPSHSLMNESSQDQLAENIRLAQKLGGRVVTLPGDNIVDAVIGYSRSHNITQIIVGKPIRPRWIEWLRGSWVDEIMRQSGSIDVYVISSAEETQTISSRGFFSRSTTWLHYLPISGLIVNMTILAAILDPFVSPPNLVMPYLIGVVIAAVRLGRGPAVLLSVLSVIALNFFFVDPRYTFVVSDASYLLTFAGLLLVGIVIASQTARVRDHARAAQRREAETSALYAFSQETSATTDLRLIVDAALRHISQGFDARAGIYLAEGDNLHIAQATLDFPSDASEFAVAMWAYQHQQAAGKGTDTLPAAKVRYMPLRTSQSAVGVLGIYLNVSSLSPERERWLEAFANQTALSIEAVKLTESAHQAQLLREAEKLQTALLNSISHDLRTPLVTITGTLSSLRDQADVLDKESQLELLDGAWEEANRLNQLVGNLLDMTRLESHSIKLNKTSCDVQDLIGAALNHLQKTLVHHPVQIEVLPDLPPVAADFVLIMQVFINLLDNAAKYSPEQAPIDISAHASSSQVAIQIADRGMGIPAEHLDKIFQKFYRIESAQTGGLGLGLSICQGIVEAHGGQISAQQRGGGGSIFTFTLPISDED